MNTLKKIVATNLTLVIAYSGIIHFSNHNQDYLSVGLASASIIGIHSFMCLLLAAVLYDPKSKEAGKAFILSAVLVVIVGFSTCLGSASLK